MQDLKKENISSCRIRETLIEAAKTGKTLHHNQVSLIKFYLNKPLDININKILNKYKQEGNLI